MVGIVVVSHSAALARAAVGLATQMAGDQVRVEIAAGLDEDTLGTDAAAVAEAVTRADDPAGVLVLVDLGSAVLSADMACEFLDPEVAQRVHISPAPLVEGLVAAVVTAGSGAGLQTVAAEAAAALDAKKHQLTAGLGQDLDGSSPDGPVPAVSVPGGPGPAAGVGAAAGERADTMEIVVPNAAGLHARPAAEFVRLAGSFDAELTVRNQSKATGPAIGSSLSQVAGLQARQGDRLVLAACGPQAAELLTAVRRFAESNFGDEPEAGTAPGRWADTGPVHGPLAPFAVEGPAVPDLPAHDLDSALAHARAQLEQLRDEAQAAGRQTAAQMLDAQLTLLHDPALLDPVRRAVADGQPELTAWSQQVAALHATFEAMADPFMRARGQDVTSIGRRVGVLLRGRSLADPASAAGVLLMDELDAPTAAALDPSRVLAVLTRHGGVHGHGVMLAAERGLPVVADVAERFDALPPGTTIRVDARRQHASEVVQQDD